MVDGVGRQRDRQTDVRKTIIYIRLSVSLPAYPIDIIRSKKKI